jgi:hypothetical protein
MLRPSSLFSLAVASWLALPASAQEAASQPSTQAAPLTETAPAPASAPTSAPAPAPAASQPASQKAATGLSSMGFRVIGEGGFLGVLGNRIQLSQDGTEFDYVREGGQDILSSFRRVSAEVRVRPKHELVFLYQPLSLSAEVLLENDEVIDGLAFAAGTSLEATYNFPFWRASYLYHFRPNSKNERALGLSLQLRNATISFRSLDGSQFRTNRDLGPVPILKAKIKQYVGDGLWIGAEADGFYAPISYLNGSDNEVIGAILDASLRAGIDLPRGVGAFLNLRYLGGGSVGTAEPEGPNDGFTENWLHFITLSLGMSYDLQAKDGLLRR